MSGHTKGLWRVIKKQRAVGYANFEIAYTDDDELVCDIVYEESDARLIAAAPDLLEALCALVLNHDAGGITRGALIDAKAAIAKATGETK